MHLRKVEEHQRDTKSWQHQHYYACHKKHHVLNLCSQYSSMTGWREQQEIQGQIFVGEEGKKFWFSGTMSSQKHNCSVSTGSTSTKQISMCRNHGSFWIVAWLAPWYTTKIYSQTSMMLNMASKLDAMLGTKLSCRGLLVHCSNKVWYCLDGISNNFGLSELCSHFPVIFYKKVMQFTVGFPNHKINFKQRPNQLFYYDTAEKWAIFFTQLLEQSIMVAASQQSCTPVKVSATATSP